MKNNKIGMFLALGAACVCGSALNAQVTSENLLAKVPFAFQVPGGNFEAGKYLLSESGYLGVPSIQNVESGRRVFVLGADHALGTAGSPKLVFHCYSGNSCFLAEIHPRTGRGSHVAMTKAEKEIAYGDQRREMATISVALRAD